MLSKKIFYYWFKRLSFQDMKIYQMCHCLTLFYLFNNFITQWEKTNAESRESLLVKNNREGRHKQHSKSQPHSLPKILQHDCRDTCSFINTRGHGDGLVKLSGKYSHFTCKVSLNGFYKYLWHPQTLSETKNEFLFNLLLTSSNNAYTSILTFMPFAC